MTGVGEASLVLGLISSTITIIDTTTQVYQAVKDETGLPTNFKKSAIKLPLISKLLEDAETYVKATDASIQAAFEPTLKGCKVQATHLQQLFEKVMPEEGDSRWDRYLKAARTIGKGGRVENLMKGILDGLQLLATKFPEVTTTRGKDQLAKAVEEVNGMESSLPDDFEQTPTFAHYGSGAQNNNMGGGTQNINTGTGNQNNGPGQQYIGTNHIDHQKHKHIHGSSTRTQYQAEKIYIGSPYDGSTDDAAEKIRKECMNEVPLTDPVDDKAGIVSRFGLRVEGTCDWITKHEKYRSWLQAEHSSLLWICGEPATGKTYLSVFLAGKLEKAVNNGSPSSNKKELLVYYFSSQQDERRNTAVALLRGLMHLVLQAKPELVNCMLEDFYRFKKHNSLFDPSNKEALWRNFVRMLLMSGLDKIYFVLDALDECAENLEWLLQKLTTLVSPDGPTQRLTLKIVIASRRYPETLQEHLYRFPQIIVGQNHNSDNDLRLFISSKIKDLAERKSSKEEDNRKRAAVRDKWLSVVQPLMKYTNETFLWVSFVIRDLEKSYLSEVEQRLRKLPHDLDGYYKQMLDQISGLEQTQHEAAASVIRWVALAVRPLSLLELSIATDTLPTKQLSREEVMEDHVNLCGYFLKVDHGIVSLIHQSARDYLTSINQGRAVLLPSLFRIDEVEENLQIAQTCVKYIQGDLEGTGPFAHGHAVNLGHNKPNLGSVEVEAFPLLQYAALNWPEHAKRSSRDEAVVDLSVPFFETKSLARHAWLHSYWLTTMPYWPPPGGSFDLIHMSAFFGLKSVTQNLLSREGLLKQIFTSTVNQKSDLDMTPLHWAVRNGHESVAKLLVDRGADTGMKGYGFTPLIWAVRNGHEGIAKMLLDHEAKIDQKGYGMTALHWAAWEGREGMVHLLLGHGADSFARTTSQDIGSTSRTVSDVDAINGEFPWATVDEANLFSHLAQLEDEIVTEKRSIKLSVSLGAYAIAHVSSFSLMLIHIKSMPPWTPPPRALLLTLASTLLGGFTLGTATDGLRFLWIFFGFQGLLALEGFFIAWYCDGSIFPYARAWRSARCVNYTNFSAIIYLGIFLLADGVLCILAAALTLSGDNPLVGSYKWAWRPFTVFWWIGLVACVARLAPNLVLYWCFVGATILAWGTAMTAALSKDPPLGKTAAQLAASKGFVKVVQLLEGIEERCPVPDTTEIQNDLVSSNS